MVNRRPGASPPVDTPDRPDVGFTAAAGVYVAVLLSTIAVSVSVVLGSSIPATIASITSSVPIGLILGALLVSRFGGVPERLGRRRSWQALLFVPVIATVALFVATVTVPSIPSSVAIGAGIGAVGAFVVASALVAMGRTRYARAMVPGRPIVTIPLLNPKQDRMWFGFGTGCLVLSGTLLLSGWGQETYRPVVILGMLGLFGVFSGWSLRRSIEAAEGDRPFDSRVFTYPRRFYGTGDPTERTTDGVASISAIDEGFLPTIEVHGRGLIVEKPLQKRFIPWSAITGVQLTGNTLVIERRRRRSITCATGVIDDPNRVYEAIERERVSAKPAG